MADDGATPLDDLWAEYGEALKEFDDLSLARWMAQTLAQFRGRAWRFSHPLVGVYRLAAQIAHDRQIWFKRLVDTPRDYFEADCCRAPLLPLVTRDLPEMGLICQHCAGTAVALEDIPAEVQGGLKEWACNYNAIHDIAHWDDEKKKRAGKYQEVFEDAAHQAEKLLVSVGSKLVPQLMEHYPAVIWEDQDECLDVRPEDIRTWK
ncbi:MAG: hypothetical protein ACI9OD_005294 [Limisphaerales bacterium]|jgi:hypothetical protein